VVGILVRMPAIAGYEARVALEQRGERLSRTRHAVSVDPDAITCSGQSSTSLSSPDYRGARCECET
jgi:hypothetical protein